MQLPAAQTSLEPHPHRVNRTGRRPIVSQNTRRRRQPTLEQTRPAQRPRIPDPRAPGDDLNKLPTLWLSTSRTSGWFATRITSSSGSQCRSVHGLQQLRSRDVLQAGVVHREGSYATRFAV
jgi:hypothetical protein